MQEHKITKGLYRHFKGGVYRVQMIAEHTETGERFVVYCKMGETKWYARPLSMFASEVDREKYPNVMQKYRFERVEA